MKEKIKKFWEDHKERVVIGGLTVSAFVLGYFISESRNHSTCEPSDEEVPELPSGLDAQLIDEDIFTSIAPQIETLVLEEGLDEGYIERTYTVEYPKNGNPDEGYYEVKKKVEVHVHDMTE